MMNVYNLWCEQHPDGFVRDWGTPQMSQRRGQQHLSLQEAGFANPLAPSLLPQAGASSSHNTPPLSGQPSVRANVFVCYMLYVAHATLAGDSR